MTNDNPWNNDKYDPEAERCCKDCGKTFKTKEGVLHGKYDFHCSPCHIWWKKTWQKIYIGGGIFLFIIILLVLWWVMKYLRNEDKPKKKRRKRKITLSNRGQTIEEYEDDEDEDD